MSWFILILRMDASVKSPSQNTIHYDLVFQTVMTLPSFSIAKNFHWVKLFEIDYIFAYYAGLNNTIETDYNISSNLSQEFH